MRQACARGVLIDLLWGAAHGEENKERYSRTAMELAELVRADRLLCGRLRIGLQSTGSHCKILLADIQDGSRQAVLGSCNWLKSPFQSVEISAVLRHPHIVAQVASTLQKLTGTHGLNDPLASEMALLARDLLNRAFCLWRCISLIRRRYFLRRGLLLGTMDHCAPARGAPSSSNAFCWMAVGRVVIVST
jgi:hypothetical protein